MGYKVSIKPKSKFQIPGLVEYCFTFQMRAVRAGSVTAMGSLNPQMQEWQECGQLRFSFFNFLSIIFKIFIAYAQFTHQVDLNVVYRDNTGYDQGGLGSGWSPVPGGKMRLVLTVRSFKRMLIWAYTHNLLRINFVLISTFKYCTLTKVFSCEAQLNKCTFLSVCPSVCPFQN